VNTTQHYAPVPNSGVNAIVMVDAATLTDRDEIAVVDKSGRIAGAGVVQRGKALLAIWGDNPVTAEIIEGAVEGEELTLNVWRNAEQTEMSLALLSLTDGITGESLGPNLRYQQNAVWIATVTLSELLPTDFTLEQNYPNPFNPSTVIRYGLPNEAEVELAVYNVLGQQIARLVDEKQKAGYHEVVFHREALTSGMYFYRLRAGAFIRTKKMLILR
jgi:hypothetical protein